MNHTASFDTDRDGMIENQGFPDQTCEYHHLNQLVKNIFELIYKRTSGFLECEIF